MLDSFRRRIADARQHDELFLGPSRFLVGIVDFSGKENLDAREGILRTDTWS